jgi:hypothetical protein
MQLHNPSPRAQTPTYNQKGEMKKKKQTTNFRIYIHSIPKMSTQVPVLQRARRKQDVMTTSVRHCAN